MIRNILVFHEGKKPYPCKHCPCKHCDTSFAQTQTLKHHINAKHRENTFFIAHIVINLSVGKIEERSMKNVSEKFRKKVTINTNILEIVFQTTYKNNLPII